MTPELDGGPVMMRGYALDIDYNRVGDVKGDCRRRREVAEAAQEALKHLGNHVIAGAAFKDIFDGNRRG